MKVVLKLLKFLINLGLLIIGNTKAITEDIKNINYFGHEWQMWSNKNNRLSNPISDNPDTIINTRCEHIENFAEWYDKILHETSYITK